MSERLLDYRGIENIFDCLPRCTGNVPQRRMVRIHEPVLNRAFLHLKQRVIITVYIKNDYMAVVKSKLVPRDYFK